MQQLLIAAINSEGCFNSKTNPNVMFVPFCIFKQFYQI